MEVLEPGMRIPNHVLSDPNSMVLDGNILYKDGENRLIYFLERSLITSINLSLYFYIFCVITRNRKIAEKVLQLYAFTRHRKTKNLKT